ALERPLLRAIIAGDHRPIAKWLGVIRRDGRRPHFLALTYTSGLPRRIGIARVERPALLIRVADLVARQERGGFLVQRIALRLAQRLQRDAGRSGQHRQITLLAPPS